MGNEIERNEKLSTVCDMLGGTGRQWRRLRRVIVTCSVLAYSLQALVMGQSRLTAGFAVVYRLISDYYHVSQL